MVSLPISGVVQRESGTFFVSRPHHKSTLLFHLKYYKMKENTFESSLSAEAKNRELPIDPELKENRGNVLRFRNFSVRLQRIPLETGDDEIANPCRLDLFYGRPQSSIVPTPVRSVNAPAACFKVECNGKAVLFLYPAPPQANLIVSFKNAFQK
nr:MAG TPA: hypothetical protein [Caudoviricetes sp.]